MEEGDGLRGEKQEMEKKSELEKRREQTNTKAEKKVQSELLLCTKKKEKESEY